jgi:hypothetical protein
MVTIMNPLTWRSTVTLPLRRSPPTDDAPLAAGHHEPLTVTTMNRLAWCFTVTQPWS